MEKTIYHRLISGCDCVSHLLANNREYTHTYTDNSFWHYESSIELNVHVFRL